MEQREELETTREGTIGSLEQAKGTVEETTPRTEQVATETAARTRESSAALGQAASERLQETSRTLSAQMGLAKERAEHGMKNVREETERAVRRNPGPSLVAAAVLGFLAGSLIWR